MHRGARALGTVVGEERPADFGEPDRRHEDGLRGLAGDGLGRAAEHPRGELLVQAAVSDDHEVGRARRVADLVRDDPHRERRVARHVALAAPFGERIEQHPPPLLQRLAHLRREIEVGLEAERARHVVEERALDRDDVDHVHPGDRRA